MDKKITITFEPIGNVHASFEGSIHYADLLVAAKHLEMLVEVRMGNQLYNEMMKGEQKDAN